MQVLREGPRLPASYQQRRVQHTRSFLLSSPIFTRPLYRPQGFASGSIAAIAAGCITHPIDLVKARQKPSREQRPSRLLAPLPRPITHAPARPPPLSFQVRLQISQAASSGVGEASRPGIVSITRGVLRSEGVLGLYAGLSGSVLRQTILVGSRLGFYDALKNQFVDGNGNLSFEKAIACGAAAGAAAAVIGNPADMVMVRMQADGSLPLEQRRNYRHAGEALVRIVRQEGLLALWRGTESTVSRAMIVTAAQMAFYDKSKQILIEVLQLPDAPGTHSIASLVAGGVAAIASNPFDVAKTRLQNMKPLPGGGFPYRGMFHCIFTTSRAEGFLALYKVSFAGRR